MTQYGHNLVAGIIIIVLYQLVFHMILKHHPVTKRNIQEWSDIFDEYW